MLPLSRRILFGLATLLLVPCCFGQTAQSTQTFPLTDTAGLIPHNVTLKATEYKGRRAVLITKDTPDDGFALLPGTDFQDGTIEADLAVKITTPPGVRMPGFLGIAFRARPDATHYELFYIRPKNSTSDDQAMRNHSVQYTEAPDFGWYKLRREWPFIYEAYAPLQVETWTKIKIEVKGRSARLYLNGSAEPILVVNDLRGEDLHGSVALWGYQGEEAYFSNVRITHADAQPLKNGSDATGTWHVKYPSDYGTFEGSLKLTRQGDKLTGTWSGGFGNDLPVAGTWRDGYVEIKFPGTWGDDHAPVTAHLAGWIDGDSAAGRMVIEGRADGPWTATRQ
jgi:hypothetical protein